MVVHDGMVVHEGMVVPDGALAESPATSSAEVGPTVATLHAIAGPQSGRSWASSLRRTRPPAGLALLSWGLFQPLD